MSRLWRVLVVGFCAVVLAGGLARGDLLRNEGLRAALAAEALATGNWLVPTLHGEPHLSKPPGMTILIAVCSLPVGEVTTVTARLPSVLAGACVLLAWGLTFRRLCGPGWSFLAAALLPCSWLWLERAPSAEIDLVQLAWVSGALLCLLRAVEIEEEKIARQKAECGRQKTGRQKTGRQKADCRLTIDNFRLPIAEASRAALPLGEERHAFFPICNLKLSIVNCQSLSSTQQGSLLPSRQKTDCRLTIDNCRLPIAEASCAALPLGEERHAFFPICNLKLSIVNCQSLSSTQQGSLLPSRQKTDCRLTIDNCRLPIAEASRGALPLDEERHAFFPICNLQSAIVNCQSLFPHPASPPNLQSALRNLQSLFFSSRFWWLAALFCVAGGLFTKWTAPAFFYLTAIPWLYCRGRLRLLARPAHLGGATLVAIAAVAWLALAGATAGWQVLLDTLGREALLRLSPGHHPRPYPWDELVSFPLGFLAGCLPAALLAVASLFPGFRAGLDERQRRLWQLCQAWLWVNLLFWTIVPGHRPRHLLPAQPAVAALACLVCFAWARCRPERHSVQRRLLVGLFAGWLAVKLIFVAAVLPARQARRQPRAAGERLAALVPAGATIYLCRLKDEGLLFYCGRPARRLTAPQQLPAGGWCLLTGGEWQSWPRDVPAVPMAELRDGQGAALVLVRRGVQR